MNRVGYPSPNKLNGGYTNAHKGYDIDDVPDKNVRCSLVDAVCVQSKNSETRTWLANQASDPYKNDSRRPGLITEDYGNYAKIKGKDLDGNEIYQLTAHMKPNTVIKQGERVHLGQVIGQTDERGTGNSSGGHTHTEYRTLSNVHIPVQFVEIDTSDPVEAPVYKWLQDLAHENNVKEENIEGWIRDSLDKARKQEKDREMLVECETDKKTMDLDIKGLKKTLSERSGEVLRLDKEIETLKNDLEEANKTIKDLRFELEEAIDHVVVLPNGSNTPTTESSINLEEGGVTMDYPNWKKAAWEAWRVFSVAFVGVATAQVSAGIDMQDWKSWVTTLLVSSFIAGIKAVGKYAREEFGNKDYSSLLYKLPL